MFLRQSTTQTIRFGPCLDISDGKTEEVSLTLAQADMRLSKDGGAFAQKNASGNATHDSDGWYSTALNATDTATVGELILNVHQPANMLPVWMRFYVVEEAVYDAFFAASAAGIPSIPANWITAAGINADAITAAKIADDAIGSDQLAAGAIWAGTIAADAIGASELATDAVNEIRDAILTDTPTESYAADGSVPSLIQAVFEIRALLCERDTASVTVTTKKVDGSTTANTYTINDAVNPTNITKSS